jgi:hypothetical protein
MATRWTHIARRAVRRLILHRVEHFARHELPDYVSTRDTVSTHMILEPIALLLAVLPFQEPVSRVPS